MAQIPGTKYTLDTEINSLLQIGDNAYFLPLVDPTANGINVVQTQDQNGNADNGVNLGKVVLIGTGYIKCDIQLDQSELDFVNLNPGLVVFEKDVRANESGLKGYYAEIELKNFSRGQRQEKAELFHVNSEVVYSSK